MADVWYPQINLALKKLIQQNVFINQDGFKKPIPVQLRFAEEKFTLKPPCCTLFAYDEKIDKFRYPNNVELLTDIDKEKGTAIIRKPAKPFSIYIQVDFWSDYLLEVEDMCIQWNRFMAYRNGIIIPDSEGVPQKIDIYNVNFRKGDILDADERQFQRTYCYLIKGYIDDNYERKTNIVTKPTNIGLNN